ncbi:MAG: hypothetical protein IJN86_02870 [Clostridia bacterium]|nr:hypothetical protein [Clostridia bacterium]
MIFVTIDLALAIRAVFLPLQKVADSMACLPSAWGNYKAKIIRMEV